MGDGAESGTRREEGAGPIFFLFIMLILGLKKNSAVASPATIYLCQVWHASDKIKQAHSQNEGSCHTKPVAAANEKFLAVKIAAEKT